jgi:ribose 5-phosphate isomerase B
MEVGQEAKGDGSGKSMKIIIGSDHAGFGLKEACKQHLESSGTHQVQDVGVFSRESSDYPKIAHTVAQAVSRGERVRGILICGSGLGMSMVANRYRGVRAALCHNIYSARLSRLHNDANVLAMGERVLGVGLALEILDAFLNTEFEGGRHKARVDQIDAVIAGERAE